MSNQKAKVRAYWWRKRNTHDGGVLQARIDGPVPSVVTGGGVTPNDDGVFRARINGPVPSVATGGTPNDGGVLQARIERA